MPRSVGARRGVRRGDPVGEDAGGGTDSAGVGGGAAGDLSGCPLDVPLVEGLDREGAAVRRWGLPPLIPPELVGQYRASDELVRLRSGGEILFRSLEEGQVSKILNRSLAGVMVDQIG
jgi:hypothetical protein